MTSDLEKIVVLPTDLQEFLLEQRRTICLVRYSRPFDGEWVFDRFEVYAKYENITMKELPYRIMKDPILGKPRNNPDPDESGDGGCLFEKLIHLHIKLMAQIPKNIRRKHNDTSVKPELIEHLYTYLLSPKELIDDILNLGTLGFGGQGKVGDQGWKFDFFFEDEGTWQFMKNHTHMVKEVPEKPKIKSLVDWTSEFIKRDMPWVCSVTSSDSSNSKVRPVNIACFTIHTDSHDSRCDSTFVIASQYNCTWEELPYKIMKDPLLGIDIGSGNLFQDLAELHKDLTPRGSENEDINSDFIERLYTKILQPEDLIKDILSLEKCGEDSRVFGATMFKYGIFFGDEKVWEFMDKHTYMISTWSMEECKKELMKD